MEWIIFSLLATEIFAANYFIDKHISTNLIKNYRGMPIYGAIVGLLVGTLFWLITGRPILPNQIILILISAGMLNIFASYFYFTVLSRVDASFAIILNRMESLFVLILSFIVLKQSLTILQLIGFFIILISVCFLSFGNNNKHVNKIGFTTFLIFVVCNLMWASNGILVNIALKTTAFPNILSYESWGLGIGGILLYIFVPTIRKAFLEGPKVNGIKPYLTILFNELIYVGAKSSYFYAFSLGPAALVSIVGSTQVLSAIVFGFILSKIFPHHFNEDISKSNIRWKITWGIIIIFGLILIS